MSVATSSKCPLCYNLFKGPRRSGQRGKATPSPPGTPSRRNEPPMMLMMLAHGASIISIIGGSFLQSEVLSPPLQPAKIGARSRWPSGLVSKNLCAHDAFLVGLGTRKILQTSLRGGGIRFKTGCQFRLSFGVGSGRAPEETENQRCRVLGTVVRSMAKPGQWPAAAPGRWPIF